MRTQVGIVGAGPAGLMLSHLLHRAGIDSVIVEDRSRDYVEGRVRAGVIEHWAADLLVEAGVGARMQREGLVHNGIHLGFNDQIRSLDFRKLIGRGIVVYGQHEVVKDLIAQRLADDGQILFGVEEVSVHALDTTQPVIRFAHQGVVHELECDFIAGCDGFHGICRPSIPDGALKFYERGYPFGWLGILAEAPPVDDELIYSYHARGFALFSTRSPQRARYYLQCPPDEDIDKWSDGAIWDELQIRLGAADGRILTEGPIVQKSITPMRSFVTAPMQYGRLFLAGDAAHIAPPTGAKGMNLALADVLVLSRGLEEFYRQGRANALHHYSSQCLKRIWKAQRFSWWMTQMLHRFSFVDDFDHRRQLAELDCVTSSDAAMRALAENYVGLPME